MTHVLRVSYEGRKCGTMTQVRVMRGEEIFGTIYNPGPDQPFFSGAFSPTAALEEVRPLFDNDLRLLESYGDKFDGEAWEQVYCRILNLGIRLAFADGSEVSDFLLHIDGVHAWFRY